MLRVLFMAAIAIFLLFLYAYATWYAINALACLNAPTPCTAYPYTPESELNPIALLSLVGGLVSALVISVLALTDPNETPDTTLVNSVQSTRSASAAPATPLSAPAALITRVLTYLYLAVWFVCGVAAVYAVYMGGYAKGIPELTTAAKSWLGLAIASAYALFGLKAS